jgi:hypothetical protein
LRTSNDHIHRRFYAQNYDSPRTAVDYWVRSGLGSRIALVKPIGILLS